MCFALIYNVILRVKGFRGKTSAPRGLDRLGQPPPRNAKRARLAAFDKIGNVFSFTYSQIMLNSLVSSMCIVVICISLKPAMK